MFWITYAYKNHNASAKGDKIISLSEMQIVTEYKYNSCKNSEKLINIILKITIILFKIKDLFYDYKIVFFSRIWIKLLKLAKSL